MPLVNDTSTEQPEDSLLRVYVGFTLVDITCTKVTNAKDTESFPKARNQQRNWETIVQILSLRAQPIMLDEPSIIEDELQYHQFGEMFSGTHKIWMFKFGIEHDGAYGEDFKTLKFDCNLVPIITGLDETVKIRIPVFSAYLDECNIYFTQIK